MFLGGGGVLLGPLKVVVSRYFNFHVFIASMVALQTCSLFVCCSSNNMAAFKQPGTRKFLTSEEVAAIFSKGRKSVDPCSEYSSTTDDTGGNLSDFWDSSDYDVTDSDSDYSDSPTDISGSSPAEIELEEELDARQQFSNGWETTEGRQLRPRKRTLTLADQLQPPRKKCRVSKMPGSECEGQSQTQKRDGAPGGRQDSVRGRCRGVGKRGRGGSQGSVQGDRGQRRGGGRDQGQCGSGGNCPGSGQGRHGRGRGQRQGQRGRLRGRGRSQGGGRGRGRSQGGGRGRALSGREHGQGDTSKGTGKGKAVLKPPRGVKSISEKDEGVQLMDEFCPLRDQGPHLPEGMEVSALSLFELFFDNVVMERIRTCTLAYAESKKSEKKKRYDLFAKQLLTKAVLMAFIGALILLGIHRVRNHRKAWSSSRAQVIVRLSDLLTCQRFELLGSFLHVVSPEEEVANASNRLRKLLPLLNHVKDKCLEYYQPLQHLSVDERMVKSKSRCHMIQYMKDKPTKWGFKLWVVADTSGYTVDFNIYTGKAEECSEYGLTHDVVMKLVEPFCFQGYQVFVDNYYSSPTLFHHLLEVDIRATGTLRTYRRGVPDTVVQLKAFLEKSTRGSGYYYRENESPIMYVCWHDVKVTTVLSTAFPGHTDHSVIRKVVSRHTGRKEPVSIPRPIAIGKYNAYMGGVDKSDQFLSYHNILRKTVRYWKTLFYHMIDIAVVNSHILYNYTAVYAGRKTVTENDFRDTLVLQIIGTYGREKQQHITHGRPPSSSCRVRHGSQLGPTKYRCQYCKVQGKTSWTHRKCLDCLHQPALCQTAERDCHSLWHQPSFDVIRNLWFSKKSNSSTSGSPSARGHRGRPRGAINKRKRRGMYRSNI